MMAHSFYIGDVYIQMFNVMSVVSIWKLGSDSICLLLSVMFICATDFNSNQFAFNHAEGAE